MLEDIKKGNHGGKEVERQRSKKGMLEETAAGRVGGRRGLQRERLRERKKKQKKGSEKKVIQVQLRPVAK